MVLDVVVLVFYFEIFLVLVGGYVCVFILDIGIEGEVVKVIEF